MADVHLDIGIDADQRIIDVWAWIAVHANGGEGIISGVLPGLGLAQLFSANEAMAQAMEPLAKRAVKVAPKGTTCELRKFTVVRH